MEFRKIDEQGYNLALQHLCDNFYTDAPIALAVEFTPGEKYHREMDIQYLALMREGYSIGLFENEKLIGLVINGIIRPGCIEKELEELKIINEPKLSKVFNFIYSITEKLDLFTKYGVDEIFEIIAISVDRESRGRGIARELVKRSMQLAKDHGQKVLKVDATSAYSAKIFNKLGYMTIYEQKYKDYVDPETGLPVFNIPAPHESVFIMMKRLDQCLIPGV